MKRTRFANWPCGIARTTDLMGDWWTPLVVREAMYGTCRFDEFQEILGLSRNILAERLKRLVDVGVLDKVAYQERPLRYEYHLTEQGRDLAGVLLAELAWGNRWMSPNGAPVVLTDRETGEQVDPIVVDRRTGQPVDMRRLTVVAGPGFPPRLRQHPQAIKRFGPAPEPSPGGSR